MEAENISGLTPVEPEIETKKKVKRYVVGCQLQGEVLEKFEKLMERHKLSKSELLTKAIVSLYEIEN